MNIFTKTHGENFTMRKKWTVKIVACTFLSAMFFLSVYGCKKQDGQEAKLNELCKQIVPLQICGTDKNTKTFTLIQAMDWHEGHESEHHAVEQNTIEPVSEETHQEQHHFCLGVVIGYQAILYATNELFQDGIPQASDFDINVKGPMDGVWDVMSLYTGKNLQFTGEPQKMDLTSFTFTAKRLSSGKSLTFCLREGFVPEEFFTLKNQGATCGNPQLRVVKQQALLNILSTEPENCFQVIDANTSK
jgi:hypothetical protein